MGFCNNQKSYYFGCEVDEGFKEECGRSCRGCPYYYDPESDPVVSMSEYLLNKLKKVETRIKVLEKTTMSNDEERKELEEMLVELKREKKQILEQIREFREDVIKREKPFPFF